MPMSSKPRTVLIIEDDGVLRDALDMKLTDQGYTVLTAEDGRNGLSLALQHKPDLILLDLIMPKMGGLNVLDTLRTDPWGKTAPVIVITNDASSLAQQRALSAAAPSYFIKSNTSLREIADAVFYHFQ